VFAEAMKENDQRLPISNPSAIGGKLARTSIPDCRSYPPARTFFPAEQATVKELGPGDMVWVTRTISYPLNPPERRLDPAAPEALAAPECPAHLAGQDHPAARACRCRRS